MFCYQAIIMNQMGVNYHFKYTLYYWFVLLAFW
jgi:hypothetical protein